MTPGPRTHKQASCRVVIPLSLPEHMRSGVREVLDVVSNAQRRGEASALMHQLCDEADRNSFVLMLRPVPFADGMDAAQLEKFYGKFGFVTTQTEPCVLMLRPPIGFDAAAQVMPAEHAAMPLPDTLTIEAERRLCVAIDGHAANESMIEIAR